MSKTRIIEAVRRLDLDTTRILLTAKPALLTVTDRQGRNLLHIACSASGPTLKRPESAAVKVAALLLDRGIDIDATVGKDRCTALFFSVGRARNTALLRFLLRRGATPALAPGYGMFAAGWYEDLDHIDILLAAGAPVDVTAGVTVFLACWNWRRFKAAKHLAIRGADVNAREPKGGRTALHYGVEKEFEPRLLKWLVAHGASPDIANRDGETARVKASRKRDKKWHAALS